MNGPRVLSYFVAFAKGYLRNPLGLFFSLIFPVILILIFGAVFANSGSSAVPLYVENLDHNSPGSVAFLQALDHTGAVQVNVVIPPAGTNLSSYLASNGESAGLLIPAGFQAALTNKTHVTLQLFTNPSAASQAGIVIGAVQGVESAVNLQEAGGSTIVTSTYFNVGSQIYTYIDYLIPGLIGFSILTSPMFSMVNISSTWKRDKLFRQLSLTPLTRAEWLTAALIWYVLLALVSAFVMIGVGRFVFGAHVSVVLWMFPFLLAGPVLFVSLGLVAGSASKTPESAAVVGNVILFPMMFLSGTFFPVSGFSPPLQNVAHVLPLYYVIDGLNAGILFGNGAGALRDFIVTAVIALVFFIAAIRLFSWRED
ncbi:MAG: ABC transporter permease [Thermoplasmata archaeon]|nr:ABC transporter permease [Thermoplasmata archaeon]